MRKRNYIFVAIYSFEGFGRVVQCSVLILFLSPIFIEFLYHVFNTFTLTLGAPSILVTNFFGEVTKQITNFKSSFFLFQVIKMCCIVHLRLLTWNFHCNWTIQHILVTWNSKIEDLRLVIWLVTSPKIWWLEWTARLTFLSIGARLLFTIEILVERVDTLSVAAYTSPLFFPACWINTSFVFRKSEEQGVYKEKKVEGGFFLNALTT